MKLGLHSASVSTGSRESQCSLNIPHAPLHFPASPVVRLGPNDYFWPMDYEQRWPVSLLSMTIPS